MLTKFRTLALSAILAASIVFGSTAAVYADNFKDIDKTADYAKNAVVSLSEKNIITGNESGNFNPKETLTRAQMVAILVRGLGYDVNKLPDKPTFKDVPKTHWAYKYVEVAYQKGLVKGTTKTTFSPNAKCTREQMAKIIVKSVERPRVSQKTMTGLKTKIKKFKDYKRISAWAVDDVAMAVDEGIMNGTGPDTFTPEGYATREQTAVVTNRFFENNDIDENEVASTMQLSVIDQDLVFSFNSPVKNVNVRKITDSQGNVLNATFDYLYDDSQNLGNMYIPQGEYSIIKAHVKNADLKEGESYTVHYSFLLGGYKEKIAFSEQQVQAKGNGFSVESVVSVNASQIRVNFTSSIGPSISGKPENYHLSDMEGSPATVKAVKVSEDAKWVLITLDRPVMPGNSLMLDINMAGFDGNTLIDNYSTEVKFNDRKAPYVVDFKTTMDKFGQYDTLTITFSEPVYSGSVMSDGNLMANASGEEVTIPISGYGDGYYLTIYVKGLSDGINTSTDPNGRKLPIIMRDRVNSQSPKITNVSYNKDSTGKVKELVLTVDKDLPFEPGFAGGAISALDKYNRAVYVEPVPYDQYGNPILVDETGSERPLITLICYTAKPVEKGDRTLIFPIADGAEIYNGLYTFYFDSGLFYDQEMNPNQPSKWTLDFSKN